MRGIVIMQTTVASAKDARAIARHLVEQSLAACVQITPTESFFRWQGKVDIAEEFRLDIKTSAPLLTPLRDALRSLHPYDTPELMVFTPADASGDYVDWVMSATAPPQDD